MITAEQINWDTIPLRSLCLETTTVDPTRTPDRVFEYVDVSAVSNDLWKIVGSTRHTGATAPGRARKLVRAQDVIFATVRPSLKRIALVPQNLDEQVVSTAFCVLRADPTKADPRFIYYSLLTEDFVNQVSNLERGASYPAVTDKDILEQEIVVPPLPEQRAIAAVLSKIQAAVEVQEKIVTTLKELKAATIAKLFSEGLRGEPLKQTEIGEIPEGWNTRTIASLGNVVTGTTPPTKNPDYYGGAIPFISPVDIGKGRIVRTTEKTLSESGVTVSRPLPPRSVMVVCIGSTIGKVGMTWAPVSCTNQQINAIVCNGEFIPEFVHYLMVWNADRIRNLSTPSPVPILSKGAFGEAVVGLPLDHQEQEKIATILCAIDDRIETAERHRDVLKGAFSSMLHLLMTGQARVRELIGLTDNFQGVSATKITKGVAGWNS